MDKKLVVLSSGELVICFLIQGDTVYRILAEERGKKRYLDSIFKGKVKRLVKGMDGVFVDVGLEKDAFLPLKGEEYKVGQSVVVQMVREPEGEKGAKLTTNVKLVGKYMVYFPRGKELKCSSKLQAEEKQKLCKILEGELKEEGVIMRSSAAKVDQVMLKEELLKLRELWQWIQKRAKLLRKPQLILEEYPVYIRLIRDYWQDIEEILSDDPEVWQGIASFLKGFAPEMLHKNTYLKDPTVCFQKYKLQETLANVFNKVVWLKGGGYIVIEETEAFTVIDVNSGDPTGACHEENALKTNLEAVGEIVRQILLRNIGGIILIDFIDMKKQENKNLVISSMQTAFGEEACNVNIYGFTRLGILEMSRKKTGKSVTKMLSEDCATCSGKGYIKNSSLFLFELEKDLMGYHHKNLEVEVHPLRYQSVKKALAPTEGTNFQIKENKELSVNHYRISYA
ncbi:MAG: Rne/Rng family ribonuclease [Aquificaceae bacterium]|nr:Rne/Rng family ribonuclease [Aquificaceae bacterium]